MFTKTRRRPSPTLQEFPAFFRALGDSARLEILERLAGSQDLTVGDLARQLNISQPLCSWHIRRLVKLGIVRMKRVGREARCSLDRERLQEYQRAFKQWLALH